MLNTSVVFKIIAVLSSLLATYNGNILKSSCVSKGPLSSSRVVVCASHDIDTQNASICRAYFAAHETMDKLFRKGGIAKCCVR